MFFTLPILVLLILATPVTIIFDGPIVQGVVAAIAAVSLGVIALRIRPGEAGFLSSVIRPVAVIVSRSGNLDAHSSDPNARCWARQSGLEKRGGSTRASARRKH